MDDKDQNDGRKTEVKRKQADRSRSILVGRGRGTADPSEEAEGGYLLALSASTLRTFRHRRP